MRLDLYLKISRLITRRSLAQEFCEKGLIKVNGSAAKSSKEIKAGDLIAINRHRRETVVRVTDVPQTKHLSRDAAADLFEIVSDNVIGDSPLP
jgi:ribosomal 50S subunit-recycling heat shock protein